MRRLAPVALMPAAAFAVHQLRYWLAFGSRAGAALQQQGHSYLHSLVPWIVLLVALALGAFLRALGRAFGGECSVPRYTVSFGALWLPARPAWLRSTSRRSFSRACSPPGTRLGWTGIFGYGGWWSIPASLAVGLVLAAVFHGARWVLREVAQRYARGGRRARARGHPSSALRRDVWLPRLAPLADGWSGRGPPR